MAITVERYAPADLPEWNRLVAAAKNGMFLFDRGFMEYHRDRFTDHSLLFRTDGELVALLPASQDAHGLVSHGGLTFGGLLTDFRMTTPLALECFAGLQTYLRAAGVARLLYKAIPHIYHVLPAEEDLYALVRVGAQLVRRDVTSTVDLAAAPVPQKRRLRAEQKALTQGVTIEESADWAPFHAMLSENLLARHGRQPVHSLAELTLLHGRFPDSLRLFVAVREGQLLAGTLIFESAQVAHAQYIASTAEGRSLSALDRLFFHLLRHYRDRKRYFDFGISTTDAGRELNGGLVEQKEGFGGRAVVHDFYEWRP